MTPDYLGFLACVVLGLTGTDGYVLFTGFSTSLDVNLYCHNNFCGNLSYSEMYNRYPGLFFTYAAHELYQSQMNSNRASSLNMQGYVLPSFRLPGDGDACCATDIFYLTNVTMKNIHGVERQIVHMADDEPARYQFIRHAKCLTYGECKGKCYIEPAFLNLLVYVENSSIWPPLTFDWFQVPGYCSCKNI